MSPRVHSGATGDGAVKTVWKEKVPGAEGRADTFGRIRLVGLADHRWRLPARGGRPPRRPVFRGYRRFSWIVWGFRAGAEVEKEAATEKERQSPRRPGSRAGARKSPCSTGRCHKGAAWSHHQRPPARPAVLQGWVGNSRVECPAANTAAQGNPEDGAEPSHLQMSHLNVLAPGPRMKGTRGLVARHLKPLPEGHTSPSRLRLGGGGGFKLLVFLYSLSPLRVLA